MQKHKKVKTYVATGKLFADFSHFLRFCTVAVFVATQHVHLRLRERIGQGKVGRHIGADCQISTIYALRKVCRFGIVNRLARCSVPIRLLEEQ